MESFEELINKGLKKIYNVNLENIKKKPAYQTGMTDTVTYSESYPTIEAAEAAYDKAEHGESSYKVLEVYYTGEDEYRVIKTDYKEQVDQYAEEHNIPRWQFYEDL